MIATCRFCKHVLTTPEMDLGKGICRRNPPTVFLIGANASGPLFASAQPPVTLERDTCGSHSFALKVEQ